MSLDDKMPKKGQGNAKPLSENESNKDRLGFTHPNLHRRINSPGTKDLNSGILDKKYNLGIYGNDSYRTTRTVTHDEDDFDLSEIP